MGPDYLSDIEVARRGRYGAEPIPQTSTKKKRAPKTEPKVVWFQCRVENGGFCSDASMFSTKVHRMEIPLGADPVSQHRVFFPDHMICQKTSIQQNLQKLKREELI